MCNKDYKAQPLARCCNASRSDDQNHAGSIPPRDRGNRLPAQNHTKTNDKAASQGRRRARRGPPALLLRPRAAGPAGAGHGVHAPAAVKWRGEDAAGGRRGRDRRRRPRRARAVAGDLEAAGSEAVVLYAGDDAPASADARLVEGGEGGAGIVPVVEGLASAADVGAAAQAAADKGSEALVLRGGDVEVIGPLADTAVPVLRELPFATTTNVDDLDTDAFACKTLGYAGVLLSSQSQSPVGALREALVNALGVLRSKRSRNYGGAWSESSGRVSESGDQAEAMKWARYMETTTKAGIVGAMEGGAGEDDEPLDEERGDYKAASTGRRRRGRPRSGPRRPDRTSRETRTRGEGVAQEAPGPGLEHRFVRL